MARLSIPRRFDALGLTACCFCVPHILLHETCQFSVLPAFGLSIYVFNGLRKRKAGWIAYPKRLGTQKQTHGVEILYGSTQVFTAVGRSLNHRESPLGEVAWAAIHRCRVMQKSLRGPGEQELP